MPIVKSRHHLRALARGRQVYLSVNIGAGCSDYGRLPFVEVLRLYDLVPEDSVWVTSYSDHGRDLLIVPEYRDDVEDAVA